MLKKNNFIALIQLAFLLVPENAVSGPVFEVIDNYIFFHFDLMNGGTVDFIMTDQISVN